jgi:exodeoxyribonuclease-3
LILATATLHVMLKEADVDYELRGIEKPSDHAPIWSVFE